MSGTGALRCFDVLISEGIARREVRYLGKVSEFVSSIESFVVFMFIWSSRSNCVSLSHVDF